MSSFKLLRLTAENWRDTTCSCGRLLISGWSRYLTPGRVVEFTLVDEDDHLGWTFIVLKAHDFFKVKVPLSSVGNSIVIGARILEQCLVSCTPGIRRWEVVEEEGSCTAVELPERSETDAFTYMLGHKSSLAIDTQVASPTEALCVATLESTSGNNEPIDNIRICCPEDIHLNPDRWKITFSEHGAGGIGMNYMFHIPFEGRSQIFPVPVDITKNDVRYDVKVEGLILDKSLTDSVESFRIVCRSSTIVLGSRSRRLNNLQVNIQRSSFEVAQLTIRNHGIASAADPWNIVIKKLTSSVETFNSPSCRQVKFTSASSADMRVALPFRFTSGSVYELTLKVPPSESTFTRTLRFRADLTRSDISNLHQLALRYNSADDGLGSDALCLWIYRNKPPQYFHDVLTRREGIMKVYDKNRGGDPGCPINGCIKGLFFTATVHIGSTTGEPIRKSPFGSSRLLVPAEKLLEKTPNLYFADFCCKGRPHHYVTLVMTKPGSEADLFCANHLLSVSVYDRDNNPFFFYDDSGQLRVTTKQYLLVEMFVTEEFDIRSYEIKEKMKTFGRGRSVPNGIPKNKSCNLCNLPRSNDTHAESF